jgi:hypothetical protein
MPNLGTARYAEFAAGFRRSRKGNLWRPFQGVTLTVFAHPVDGSYHWCLSDGDGPRYGERGYDEEEEAMRDLWAELEMRTEVAREVEGDAP